MGPLTPLFSLYNHRHLCHNKDNSNKTRATAGDIYGDLGLSGLLLFRLSNPHHNPKKAINVISSLK
jgi:hypothetical protein